MTNLVSRRIVLAARPHGEPKASDFRLEEAPVPAPGEGEVVLKIRYLSLDPYMRGRMSDAKSYAAPVEIGGVMEGGTVGEVVESRSDRFRAGDIVLSHSGWQSHAVADAKVLRKIDPTAAPISTALGVLGMPGMTAYTGLLTIGQPKAGETVVVAAATGPVGSAVGQIARIAGCRTVGIAGGAAKVAQCRDAFGFDAAIDYKAAGDLGAAIAAACPDGVDIYFDNTAGRVSDAVLPHLAVRARVVICGTASVSSWETWPSGPRVERHLLVKRARMQGLLVFDYQARYGEAIARLATWVREGRLAYAEDILDGIEAAPDAIAGLYRGENQGKRLIRLHA